MIFHHGDHGEHGENRVIGEKNSKIALANGRKIMPNHGEHGECGEEIKKLETGFKNFSSWRFSVCSVPSVVKGSFG